MRKRIFSSILLICLTAFNLAFLSCGSSSDSSKSKFEGLFDGFAGTWTPAGLPAGEELEITFTGNSFELYIDDSTGKVKVKGNFNPIGDNPAETGELNLTIAYYYDYTANDWVEFNESAPQFATIVDKLNTKLQEDYEKIRYKFEGANLILLDANNAPLFTFEKTTPPSVPVAPPEVPEDEIEVLTTQWLNDHNWTVGKPGKWSAYTCSTFIPVPNDKVLKIHPATTITFTWERSGFVVQGGIEAKGSHVLKDQTGKDVTWAC